MTIISTRLLLRVMRAAIDCSATLAFEGGADAMNDVTSDEFRGIMRLSLMILESRGDLNDNDTALCNAIAEWLHNTEEEKS